MGDSRALVIRASAGTGKTHQLTSRMLRLLLSDVAPEQILATTFTRKAAGEILDRVMRRLALAATDDAEAASLANMLSLGDLTRDKLLDVLVQATRSLHRLRIGTLDSFFSRVAGGFILELDLPPGWTIVEEMDEAKLRDEAIYQTLEESDIKTLLNLLHLLTKGESSVSVARLIRDTVASVYTIFTETDSTAWRRLKARKPLPQHEIELTLDDLREVALEGRTATARDQDCQRAFAEDWVNFLKNGIAGSVSRGRDKYYHTQLADELITVYEKLVKHAANELTNQMRSQTEGTYQLLEWYDRELEALKQARRAFRFDDVTRKIVDAAHLSQPELDAKAEGIDPFAFRLDGSIHHLLLDEFQDTSLSQWRVLLPLAQRVTQSPDSSFFCVGDVKQAIYGWRGGDANIFGTLGQAAS